MKLEQQEQLLADNEKTAISNVTCFIVVTVLFTVYPIKLQAIYAWN